MTGRYRTGLVLAAILGAFDVISLALTDGKHPPYAIAAVGAVLGLATLAGVTGLWRGRSGPRWFRVVVATRALSALGAVPAYFAGAPTALLIAATVFLALTCLAISLLFVDRRTAMP